MRFLVLLLLSNIALADNNIAFLSAGLKSTCEVFQDDNGTIKTTTGEKYSISCENGDYTQDYIKCHVDHRITYSLAESCNDNITSLINQYQAQVKSIAQTCVEELSKQNTKIRRLRGKIKSLKNNR